MKKGTVKFFNQTKGYGFIMPEDGSKDVFVHHTGFEGNLSREIREGDAVSYEVQDGPKGLSAVNVKRA